MIVELCRFEQMSTILKAVGDPIRLRIIEALGRGEMCVSQLTETIGASQANTSRHINTLYQAGIVKRRKFSNKVLYSIVERRVFDILDIIDSILGNRESKQSLTAYKA